MFIRKSFQALWAACCLGITVANPTVGQDVTVVDFEDLDVADGTFSFETFTSGGVEFTSVPGPFGSLFGFGFSNLSSADVPTMQPTFDSNQTPNPFFAQAATAFVADGSDPGNFAILAIDTSGAAPDSVGALQSLFQGTIAAPVGTRFESLDVANSLLAATDIQFGDFTGQPFSAVDSFDLVIRGLDLAGNQVFEQEVNLASGTDSIVDGFTSVTIGGLGSAAAIEFSLASTAVSVGSNGDPTFINTSAFLAIDNVTFVSVPEPNAVSLVALLTGLIGLRRRRLGNDC